MRKKPGKVPLDAYDGFSFNVIWQSASYKLKLHSFWFPRSCKLPSVTHIPPCLRRAQYLLSEKLPFYNNYKILGDMVMHTAVAR